MLALLYTFLVYFCALGVAHATVTTPATVGYTASLTFGGGGGFFPASITASGTGSTQAAANLAFQADVIPKLTTPIADIWVDPHFRAGTNVLYYWYVNLPHTPEAGSEASAGNVTPNFTSSLSCPDSSPVQPGDVCNSQLEAYSGSGSTTVCLSDGTCSGAATFATPAEACADRAAKGIYANAHIVATLLSGTVCKTFLQYDDGHTGAVTYINLTNLIPCAPTDSVCLSANSAAVASGVAAVQSNTASSVAATTSAQIAAAGDAAAAAVAAAGGSASAVQAAREYAVAGAATGAAVAAATPTPAPPDFSAMFGNAPAADTIPGESFTANYSMTSFLGQSQSMSCPGNISFSMFGHAYAISYQPACDLMTTMRPIFLLIGAATAAVILMGVFS
jgi:hypothetical protein